MQGWRRTMEDAHIANLDLGDGVSVFGVLDGHGGMCATALFIFYCQLLT
jgi:serine/threonine protein phosphatase PrpC